MSMDVEMEAEVNQSQGFEKQLLFGEGDHDLGNLEQIEEEVPLVEEKSPTPSSGWLSFLTLDFYQSFFDVTTSQVVERVLAGMFPRFGVTLVEKLFPNPDLYGPFWLSMTLTFTVALSSNLSRLLSDVENWEFYFNEVTLIATLIYGYTWLVPCMLWAWLWWRGNRLRYTLLQLIAIYGYSLSIFIPLTFLWLINNELVRWLLLAVAISLSGSVLLTALWRPLKSENVKLSVGILVLASILHAGLWIGFKFLYFRTLVSSQPTTSFNSTAIDQ